MADKEEEAAAVAEVLAVPPVGPADPVQREEVPAAAPAATAPVPADAPVASAVAPLAVADAAPSTPAAGAAASAVAPSPDTTPLQQFAAVYPKPLATQEAVLADEHLFMETFYSFHAMLKSRPTEPATCRIPKMGGKDLDVHLLYREVSSRGGFQAVIRDRKWKEITLVFQLPRTTTSASYVLRRYYVNLLFHYEQVYRNGATGPLLAPPVSLSGASPIVQPGDSAVSEGAEPIVRKRTRKRRVLQQPELPGGGPAQAIGTTVSGAIDGKLDFGYLVTMVVGGEKLKGILYHVPPGQRYPQCTSLPGLMNSMNSDLIIPGGEKQTRRKRRRKDEMPKKDPNAPRPNRTGYNFFFAEQRQRLKALYPDKDREISRMIGEAWNALTEEEKTPYQERGVKDKERFRREFNDYREKLSSGYYDNPANGQTAGTGDAAAVSLEDHNGSDHHISEGEDSLAKEGDPQPIAESPSTEAQTKLSDLSGVPEQLNSEANPAPAVQTN